MTAETPESGLLAGQSDPAMRDVITGISKGLRARYGTADLDRDLDRDLLRLKLIAEAKERGLTWAQIGASLNMSGREAKRHAHHLARRCQRQVVTRDAATAAR